MAQVIQYEPTLSVTNIHVLPRGTGARFLEVIEGNPGSYVARAWRRKLPTGYETTDRIFIQMVMK